MHVLNEADMSDGYNHEVCNINTTCLLLRNIHRCVEEDVYGGGYGGEYGVRGGVDNCFGIETRTLPFKENKNRLYRRAVE